MRHVLAAWLMCSLYDCGIIRPSGVDARQTGAGFFVERRGCGRPIVSYSRFRRAPTGAQTTMRSGAAARVVTTGRFGVPPIEKKPKWKLAEPVGSRTYAACLRRSIW
jgi:hypothetical protein